MSHEFLEAAKSRVKGMGFRAGRCRRSKDVLGDFREVVLFLVLAGYSPNYVRVFFMELLPKVFPRLSYRGATTSVFEAVRVAREGSLRVTGDFLDLLKKYDAGPWVHDAPEWLREQYGVSRVGVGASAPGSMLPAEPLGLPAFDLATVPSVATLEELARAREFLLCWEIYARMVRGGCSLTACDLAFGLSRGFVALVERKEKGGLSDV